ncbi:hypothetical protein KM043_012137 [Ampulex compressa]|nr:hypothetical protein KM043_012137 [Ampulex compressa]
MEEHRGTLRSKDRPEHPPNIRIKQRATEWLRRFATRSHRLPSPGSSLRSFQPREHNPILGGETSRNLPTNRTHVWHVLPQCCMLICSIIRIKPLRRGTFMRRNRRSRMFPKKGAFPFWLGKRQRFLLASRIPRASCKSGTKVVPRFASTPARETKPGTEPGSTAELRALIKSETSVGDTPIGLY